MKPTAWYDPSNGVVSTDREMMEAIHMDDSPMEMGRKIEAKLRSKNNGQ
jgi:hypothetical protein